MDIKALYTLRFPSPDLTTEEAKILLRKIHKDMDGRNINVYVNEALARKIYKDTFGKSFPDGDHNCFQLERNLAVQFLPRTQEPAPAD